MNRKPNITSIQLLMMSVGSALMFPYTFMPIINTPPANQDVWIVLIFAVFYIGLISMPSLILMNKFRGYNVIELTEIILGKIFSKVALLCFAFVFLFCFSACMAIAAIFSNIALMPETPTWAFLIFACVPISYAAYKGAGTIGRLACFIVPYIMFTIVVFFLMGIGQMDLKELQPVLVDSTLLKLNLGAFFTGARYSEILIFLIFSFFLEQKVSINKTYARALCLFAIFFALMLLPTILVLGIDFASNQFNPYFIYTRQVHGFDFIEKVHAFNTLAWFPGLILKLTIYNFMGSFVLSGVFKTKSYKGFVIPISVLGFCVCLMPVMKKTSTILFLASDQVFPWLILPFTFILPLIIVTAYFIRRKKIDVILEQKKAEANLPDTVSNPAAGNSGI